MIVKHVDLTRIMTQHALILLISLTSFAGFAQQQTHLLTLEEALNMALSANRTIQMAELERSKAQADYRQTTSIFLPQAGISYTALSTNNPLNAFGFKLQQQAITQNDFDPQLLNAPSGTTNYYTRAYIQQPLVNMDHYFMRKSAIAQTAVHDLTTQRTREQVTFEVQKAYLQLQLAHQIVNVQEKALQTAQALLRFTSDRYKTGLLQKSDVLRMQVYTDAAESQLAESRSNVQNASDFISQLMNKPSGAVYHVTPLPALQNDEFAEAVSPDRADFKAFSKGIEAVELMKKSDKYSFLPRLNAFGDYYLNDKKMVGFGSNSYLIGLQLSWDFFKGTKIRRSQESQQYNLQKMKLGLDDMISQNQLMLNKSLRELKDTRLKIQQQTTAVAQAEEVLRLIENRYKQGLENTTELLTAQTQLAHERFIYEQVIYNHHVLTAYLRLLTASSN